MSITAFTARRSTQRWCLCAAVNDVYPDVIAAAGQLTDPY